MNKKITIFIVIFGFLFAPRLIQAAVEVFGPFDDGNLYYNYPLVDLKHQIKFRDSGNTRFINDIQFGPYDKMDPVIVTPAGDWYFLASKESKQLYVVNGEEQEVCDAVSDLRVAGGHIVFGCNQGGKNYYILDGQISLEVKKYSYATRGSYSKNYLIFTYSIDNQKYANVNGKEYGPYEDINDAGASEKYWSIGYREGGQNYILVNDKKYGPFTVIKSYLSKTNWAITYDKSGKHYAMVNGKEYGPFDIWLPGVSVSDDGWGIAYVKKDIKNYYYIINGKNYGPFPSAFTSSKVQVNGSYYGFVINNTKSIGSEFFHINGKNYGPNSETTATEGNMVIGPKSWVVHYYKPYQKKLRTYFIANGKEYGPLTKDLPVYEENDIGVNDAGDWWFKAYNDASGCHDLYSNKLNVSCVKEVNAGKKFVSVIAVDKENPTKRLLFFNGKKLGSFDSVEVFGGYWAFSSYSKNSIFYKVTDNGVNYVYVLTDELTEAELIMTSGKDQKVLLQHVSKEVDKEKQKTSWEEKIKPWMKEKTKLSQQDFYAINNFMVYGTQKTMELTDEDRYQSVVTFKKKNNKLPQTVVDWDQLLSELTKK